MAAELPRSADVVVVGGGIVGASTAWELAKRGAGRVLLLERSVVGAGASGRTGALLRRHYSNRPEATLAQAGWETYARWPDVVGGDPVHTPSGLVVIVDTGPGFEGNLDRLRRNVALQNGVGIPSRLISAAELRTLQPGARVDDLSAAAFEPDSGYVDAIAATRGMARAAERAGATVVEGCAVLGIETAGDRVVGLRTAGGRVETGTVVCAAGPWSDALLAPIGVGVPVEALRVQVAVLQRPLAMAGEPFVWLDTMVGFFCRPWGAGRTLVGLGGGEQHDPVDPDAFEERTDAGYGALAAATIARRMPAMAGAAALHGHAGLYDMTPDGHPILGGAGSSGPGGLFLALGFSGAGFKKGPAVGRALAEQIVDRRSALVDLTPFRLDRFAGDGWRQPWSETEYATRTDFGHRF